MKLLVRNEQTNEVEMWDQPEQFKTLGHKLKQWRNEELQRRPPKFLVMTKDNEYYLVIFGSAWNHDDEVQKLKGYAFVGAGRWNAHENPEPFFRSDTCVMSFGYDKPIGWEVEDALLAEIKRTLKVIVAACR